MAGQTRGAEILDGAAADLASVGVELDLDEENHQAYDVEFAVRTDTGTHRYVAETKRFLTPSTAALAHERLNRVNEPDVVILTEYISIETAEVLRRLGRQFVDSAGNAFLRDGGFLIWQVGRPRRRTPDHQEGHATPALVRVQFALLARPTLIGASLRSIASASGTSLGSVQSVVKQLQEHGHVGRRDGARHLRQRQRLLDDWLPLYLRVLRPRLLLGRYTGESSAWWRSPGLDPAQAQWGGETAALRLDGELRPQIATLYADELPRTLLRTQRLGRSRDGDREIVEVRRRFWNVAEIPSDPVDTVPALLAYADLLAVGDARCVESAGRIRDAHLGRLLEED